MIGFDFCTCVKGVNGCLNEAAEVSESRLR